MSFGYCILRIISRVAGSGLGNRGGRFFGGACMFVWGYWAFFN